MTAFRKLFIAAILIATGLGVALFLGEPVSIKQAFDSRGASSKAPLASEAPAQYAPAATWASNSVQLLPDPMATQMATSAPESPPLQSPLAPIPSAPVARADSRLAQTVAVNERPTTPFSGSQSPRAKLRNEAPRPIGNEPRSPATIRRAPPVESENRLMTGGDDAYKVSTVWPATPVLPAGFSSNGNSPAATTAAYDVPAQAHESRQVSPPQWPADEDAAEPTTHLIVDGDSLDKLAGRYLDDSHRSGEIFELNRDVLSSPDLLPIGAELKLPNRASRTSRDRQSRRADYPNDASVREAASGNLVPVRSMSSYDSVIPRAQLARPVAAE